MFRHFFALAPLPKAKGCFRGMESVPALFTGLPNSTKTWKEEFLLVGLFVWLVASCWCWFILREKYCCLVADGWFVMREKYCWLVADKPNE
jgi:hypothetical protein